MNPWSYKAVIVDVDGTLVQYRPDLSGLSEADAFIPQSTITAIDTLHTSGIKVAAVTGRTYDQSKDLLEKLGITGPCVFAGGATIRVIPSGEILYETSLTVESLESVSNIVYELLGEGYPVEFVPSEKNTGMTNSIWVIADKGLVEEILAKLSTIKDIYYVVNDGAGLDTQSGLLVLNNAANKGSGTKQLLDLLDVAPEDAACVGDGANDVLMFNECGLGIAMGNGEDILKQKADHVVGNIDEDGFAEAVEFILMS